jgi:pyruvate dehydrogenase E2 component (dihydrolipoamide acetyltransferase)
MATAVYMPRWGMIMEEGRVVSWLKREGDPVKQDVPIVEVETEKVVNEIVAPVTGVLRAIVVQQDQVAKVGALLAVIAAADEDAAAVESILAEAGRIPAPAASPEPASPPAPPPARSRIKISPAARRMAVEHGVDWTSLSGTGPGGRIGVADVQQAIKAVQAAPALAPAPGQPIPLTQMRKAIIRRTLESIQAPQAALCREINITPILDFRRQVGPTLAQQIGAPFSLTAILVKAVAMVLEEVPILNARLEAERIWMNKGIHIGVVVAVEGGIVVPVVRDANHKPLVEFAMVLNDLTERAREGHLTMEDLSGGTFTISNVGPLGIDFFQVLLNPPEVGALGIGRGRQRAVVVDGEIAVRTMAYFCLSSDHRVVDAAPIGQFLHALDDLLQNPYRLLLETG